MKRYIIYYNLITFLILLYTVQFKGQQFSRDPKNIFPYAPETSSLLKYQEIPVSNYTGIPNISIPIYTLKSGNLEVPLTLNYHSGGILVTDISGPVGLGWSLHTVDPIVRKINGFVDEHGIILHDDNVEDYLNQNLDNKLLRMNLITNATNASIADIAPDDFNISIPTFSGQFNYNSKLNRFVTFPLSNLNFNYDLTEYSTPETKSINRIYVSDEKGATYTFGATGRETVGLDQSNHFNGSVAWKISSISHQNGGNINFNYIKNHYRRWENGPRTIHSTYYNQGGTVDMACNGGTGSSIDSQLDSWNGDNSAYATGTYPYFGEDWKEGEEALMNEITADNVKINFFYSTRQDFDDLKKLDKIVIKDIYGKFISEKRFNYDYFVVNAQSTNSPENPAKKLKLISVDECDINGKCITTKFSYYENYSMTSRKSRVGYDYWGYFNNNSSGGYPNVPIRILDAQTQTPKLTLSGTLNSFQSTNRNINPITVNTYSLKTVVYPEGGINEFIYEPNTASNFIKKPEDHQFYFDAGAFPDMTKKYDSFTVSGYVEGSNLYTGFPNHDYSDDHSKTYVREIDISKYEKSFEMRYNFDSTFKASTFSNNLLADALYATLSIYYYDSSNAKIYLIQDVTMSPTNSSAYFHKYNNQSIPNKKIYVEIKHVYWGGLGSGNITQSSIPYSSNFRIEWDEKKINTENVDFYGGGIRIKEIRVYDKDGSYKNSIKYKYLKEDGKTSSGVLFDVPIYSKDDALIKVSNIPCSISGSIKQKYYLKGTEVSDIPKVTGMSTQGKSVGYSRVEVSKVDNVGNPKGKEIFEYYMEPPYPTGDNFLADLESNVIKREFLENRDWRNGQLTKHYILNNANEIIKKTETSYFPNLPAQINTQTQLDYRVKSILYRNIFPGDIKSISRSPYPFGMEPDNSAMGVLPIYISVDNIPGTCSGCYTPIFMKHADAFLLKENKVTEYFGNKEVITKTEYKYDNTVYPLLNTEKIVTYSDSSIEKTVYQYAQEKGNQIMMDKNMIDVPLETSVTKIANGITKTLNRTEILYPLNSSQTITTAGLILPLSVKTYDLSNNTVNSEVTYDKYDDKGNIEQYTTKDGVPISIIWGYNQTKPIIKIEGIKYNDIQNNSLITAAKNIANNGSENDLLIALDNIRKSSDFNNYQVTTYTFSPAVGVTSITPPSGIRENYKYDTFNRLQTVEDMSGKVLKEYKYNYAPPSPVSINTYYNVALNQTFYRNNCPSNYIGSSYTYSVPADKYSSNISQSDANQKAQDEITVNGQNMANAYGICVLAQDINCPFTPTDNFYISHFSSSFVYKPAINSVVAQYVFALPYSTTGLDWNQGVYIGSVATGCSPIVARTVTINNGSNVWNIVIDTSGQLILKLISGTVVYSSTPITFNFQYEK